MGFNFWNHFICDLYSELQQHCESTTRYPIPKQLDEHVWMSASLRLHAYWFPRSSLGPETALLQMSVEQFLFVHVSCFMNPSSERVPAFLLSLQVAQLEHKTAQFQFRKATISPQIKPSSVCSVARWPLLGSSLVLWGPACQMMRFPN